MDQVTVLAFASPVVAAVIGTIAVLAHGRMLRRSIERERQAVNPPLRQPGKGDCGSNSI